MSVFALGLRPQIACYYSSVSMEEHLSIAVLIQSAQSTNRHECPRLILKASVDAFCPCTQEDFCENGKIVHTVRIRRALGVCLPRMQVASGELRKDVPYVDMRPAQRVARLRKREY